MICRLCLYRRYGWGLKRCRGAICMFLRILWHGECKSFEGIGGPVKLRAWLSNISWRAQDWETSVETFTN
jgi:hypothetical protein